MARKGRARTSQLPDVEGLTDREALAINESPFRRLIDAAGQMTWTADAQGEHSTLPSGWKIFTGQTAAESIGQGWLQAVHPDDRQRVQRAWQAAQAEKRMYDVEYRVRRHDGEYRWMLVRGLPEVTDDGALRGWLGFLTDITDQKRQHHLLQSLQALSDVALSHLHLEALLPALLDRILAVMEVNNVAILLFDETRQHLKVRAAKGMEAEIDDQTLIPIGQGFAGRIAQTAEPLIVNDLTTFPVVSSLLRKTLHSAVGVPLRVGERVLGVVHVGTVEPHEFTGDDVQLLERAAERIALAIDHAQTYAAEQAALARSQAIMQAMTDGVVVCDAQGRTTAVNAATRAILGMDDAPLHGEASSPERLAHFNARTLEGQPLPLSESPIWRALHGETFTAVNAPDLLVTSLTGREIQLSVTGAPLRDESGTITGAVTVMRDVTEQRQMEREREQMVAVVGHELRTPLTSLKMRVQIAHKKARSHDADAVALLELAEQDIRRLERMVLDLNEAVHLNRRTLTLRVAPCDVVALCRETAADVERVSGRAIQVTASDPVMFVAGDALRLQQVLTNLLNNAVKYTPPTSTIMVDVRRESAVARVVVRDNGPGIPAAALPRLFEQFYRVPGSAVFGGSRLGLGLGLYIAQMIVEAHHGRIGVSSRLGLGTVFWFSLPLDADALAASGTTEERQKEEARDEFHDRDR